MVRCPGQDLRFWKLGDIFESQCPHCGTSVEFWKDEPSVKCPQCRKVIVNPRLDLGCAQWCQHAEQCLGAVMDPQSILCKKLIKEMKGFFGRDERTIDHALAVFRNAQEILACEGGDARAVNAAAILHAIGGPCPTCDTPPAGGDLSAVKEILTRCGVDAEPADQVCRIIRTYCRGTVEDGIESKILWDAEWLAKLSEQGGGNDAPEVKEFIDRTFQTQKGRDLAAALLLHHDNRSATK